MIGVALNEVIDSFIPWKDISKSYFHGKDIPVAAPAPAPEPEPEPEPVVEPKGNVKFEDDDEPPTISLGEEVSLEVDDFEEESEAESVDLKPSSDVSINL